MRITEGQKGYIAGTIDGESCISIIKTKSKKRRNPRYRATIAIKMNDPQAIRLFSDIFGGAVRVAKNNHKYKNNSNDAYVISYSGKKVKEILVLIYDYLRVKQEQARVILDFLALKEIYAKTPINQIDKIEQLNLFEEKYRKCRELKTKNWIK